MPCTFRFFSFQELSVEELYEIICLREQIFVVEQQCVYLDADGRDRTSLHLCCREAEGENALVGYLRILPPSTAAKCPAIGRVAVVREKRCGGIGRELMERAVAKTRGLYPGQPIHISAQCYLLGFYESLGFTAVSEPYLEDGIPHCDMQLNA